MKETPFIPMAPSVEQQEAGAALRARRHALGLTMRDLGDRVGVTRQQIEKWEMGRSVSDHIRAALDAALGPAATDERKKA